MLFYSLLVHAGLLTAAFMSLLTWCSMVDARNEQMKEPMIIFWSMVVLSITIIPHILLLVAVELW